MKVRINKSVLKGNVDIIGSKSYAHRYIIASFLSRKENRLLNVPLSDDIITTLNAIKALGAKYSILDKDTVLINYDESRFNEIECLESGSTLRFMIPVSLYLYGKSRFKVSYRLFKRGIEEYKHIFKNKNIEIKTENNIIELNGIITPGVYNVDASSSSQYVSGMLFVLPLLDGDSVLVLDNQINSKPYIDITISVLREYGINIDMIDNKIFVKGNQSYNNFVHYVEGDYSSASFIDAFNYFGSNVKINGLNNDSLQGDKKYIEYFSQLKNKYSVIDVSNSIDLAPILFVFASLKHGGKFTGTDRLMIKESNRSEAIKEELGKIGIDIEIGNNFVIINQNDIKIKNVCFISHNDHRIAMALSLYSTIMNIEIDDYECVNKSYKEYFDVLKSLGADIYYE